MENRNFLHLPGGSHGGLHGRGNSKARAAWQNALQTAQALLFPRRCPFCGAVLGDELLCCPDCAAKEKALRHTPPRLPETEHALRNLSGAAAAYYYTGIVSSGIRRMKYGGRFWAVRGFAMQMAMLEFGCTFCCDGGILKQTQAVLPNAGFSCIVPVPPSVRHGGAYLPGELAKLLSGMLGIPVVFALEKIRKTPQQESLDAPRRLVNVQGAFRVKPGLAARLENCRILLVDDVITTGATVSACAEALSLAGADTVFAACIAAAGEGALPPQSEPTEHKIQGGAWPRQKEKDHGTK